LFDGFAAHGHDAPWFAGPVFTNSERRVIAGLELSGLLQSVALKRGRLRFTVGEGT
jgi:hypothetical protein